jgi:hypothetical protein
MEQPTIHQDSPGWIFFVYLSFLLSTALLGLGIYLLPVNMWIKGYFVMGMFFNIGATVTLSKTMRDMHEGRKIVNRIVEVKTEKLLNDYNLTH